MGQPIWQQGRLIPSIRSWHFRLESRPWKASERQRGKDHYMSMNMQKLGSGTCVDILECAYPVSVGVYMYIWALIEHMYRLVCVCLHLSAQCCAIQPPCLHRQLLFDFCIDNFFKCKPPMCISVGVSHSIHISVPCWNKVCFIFPAHYVCRHL